MDHISRRLDNLDFDLAEMGLFSPLMEKKLSFKVFLLLKSHGECLPRYASHLVKFHTNEAKWQECTHTKCAGTVFIRESLWR